MINERTITNSSPIEFRIVSGHDDKLFGLLADLYEPFLLRSYMTERAQYMVLSRAANSFYSVGCISISRKGFAQIALAPEVSGKGLGWQAMQELVTKVSPRERVGWTAHRSNYPSLRLLWLLGGGINVKCLDRKDRVNMEGFFRSQGEAPGRMRSSLETDRKSVV